MTHNPPQDGVTSELLAGEEAARIEAASAGALVALARVSRSLGFYDPRNQTVRRFLTDLRERIHTAVELSGGLVLQVRPFELLWEGRVVYLERDRERSVAFQLFRDGVRELRIDPGVPWGEVLALLEVLAIQFSGLARGEEDVVTLLYKASLRHIHVRAVEGFVEEGREAGGGDESEATRQARKDSGAVEVPRDWDLPLPDLPMPRMPRYEPLSRDNVEDLALELSPDRLGQDAVDLVARLLEHLEDPGEPTELSQVLPMVEEVRDYLLSEGQVPQALRLLELLSPLSEDRPDELGPVVRSFSGPALVLGVVEQAARGAKVSPEQVLERLEALPGDPLAPLIGGLEGEPAAGVRVLLVKVLGRLARANRSSLEAAFAEASPQAAGDLLRALAIGYPDQRLELVAMAAARPEPEVVEVACLVLRKARPHPDGVTFLQALLKTPASELRLAVLELMVAQPGPQNFGALRDYLLSPEARGISLAESDAVGRALSRIDAKEATRTFEEWVKPDKGWKRWLRFSVDPVLAAAAVGGLTELSVERHGELVRWLARRTTGELHEHCLRTLMAQARKDAQGQRRSGTKA